MRLVVDEGPEIIRQLIEWGCRFTRNSDGALSLGREGGHTRNRIIHTDDLTGREIERALLERVKNHPNITLLSNHIAVDLLTEHNVRMVGKHGSGQLFWRIRARCGQRRHSDMHVRDHPACHRGRRAGLPSYLQSEIATGDGIAMAFRAGASVGNLEFMQFHPTTLKLQDGRSFLISEAVRGYGGVLVDHSGKRIMESHPMKDLAPRDVVARTIDHHLKSSGHECVYLDVTGHDPDKTRARFPHIHRTCLEHGIDITKDPIPVVPAAHYMCGGVVVDSWARTTISNLYAVGEVACTGLHGANRLASNSLLEAVVMADRAAQAVQRERQLTSELPDIPDWNDRGTFDPEEWVIISHDRDNIRRLMWDLVGIVRSDFRLRRALSRLAVIREEVEEYYRRTRLSHELIELRNMALTAWLIVMCARHRKESRGSALQHRLPGSRRPLLASRHDHPERGDSFVKRYFSQSSQRTQRKRVAGMRTEKELSKIILDCCFGIHSALGPGLLESVYEEVLSYELSKKDICHERQVEVPVFYESVRLDVGFRADIIVEHKLIIELKSLEILKAVHKKQLLTYLKLSGIKLGLLINFNVESLKDGIVRIANRL